MNPNQPPSKIVLNQQKPVINFDKKKCDSCHNVCEQMKPEHLSSCESKFTFENQNDANCDPLIDEQNSFSSSSETMEKLNQQVAHKVYEIDNFLQSLRDKEEQKKEKQV